MESGDNDDARSEHTDDGLYDDGEPTSDEDDSEEDPVQADAERIEEQKRIEKQERLRNLFVSITIDPLYPQLGTVQAPRWLMDKYEKLRGY
jgi:hypothetical protein